MKQDKKILTVVRREFSRRQGRTIPERLKGLALSALDSGYTVGQVARAGGMSGQSVVNWKKSSEARSSKPASNRTPPVELKVIEQRAVAEGEPLPMARIRLRSGAIVELPASMLDPRLLAALNGGAL